MRWAVETERALAVPLRRALGESLDRVRLADPGHGCEEVPLVEFGFLPRADRLDLQRTAARDVLTPAAAALFL